MRVLGLWCLLFSAAFIMSATLAPQAKAQNIFVTPDDNASSSGGGGNRNIFIPQRQTTSRPSPGAQQRGFDVFTPRGQQDQASKENDRHDIFDDVQQRNIDIAQDRAAANNQIIEQQRQQRMAQRKAERAARDQQNKVAENKQNSNVPPEMRGDEEHIDVEGKRVFISRDDNPRKMDTPPRIFNTFE